MTLCRYALVKICERVQANFKAVEQACSGSYTESRLKAIEVPEAALILQRGVKQLSQCHMSRAALPVYKPVLHEVQTAKGIDIKLQGQQAAPLCWQVCLVTHEHVLQVCCGSIAAATGAQIQGR